MPSFDATTLPVLKQPSLKEDQAEEPYAVEAPELWPVSPFEAGWIVLAILIARVLSW